jgi:hypothetical protein
MGSANAALRIGWASVDVTPERPVLVRGQFYARVSEGVADRLTVTALAIESVRDGEPGGHVVLVGCDYVRVPECLRDSVRQQVSERAPEIDPSGIILNATHTHTGPQLRTPGEADKDTAGNLGRDVGVDFGTRIMDPTEYTAWATERIAGAVVEAWEKREPGGIGFGLGFATVGYNRRICYYTGESRMYGNPDDPEFSHIEGGADPSVAVLSTWSSAGDLTGLVVNVACPSQVSESDFVISADYWHETRAELRRRFGEGLFVLPQCAAAGDQAPPKPSITIGWGAQQRMWDLQGRTEREDIGIRISDAVEGILPAMESDIRWAPTFDHHSETVRLLRRRITREDVDAALVDAEDYRKQHEAIAADLEAHPEKRQEPRWYVDLTRAYRRWKWNEAVARRFALQDSDPEVDVELHVVRLGDVAIATNPFEYYLDFGLQIKARSKALQTFIVQLTGEGAYVPTVRGASGGSYGAVAASTPVGPEGGRQLVDRTVAAIARMWEE